MKKFLATLAFAIPMLANPIVTYNTTGVFSSSGTSTSLDGALSYTFILGGATVDLGPPGGLNPSNGSLGELNSANVSADLADTLTITIHQTGVDFAPGTGTLVGTIAGPITPTASEAHITFTTTSTVINGVRYQVGNLDYLIVPNSTNGGVTSIQGIISYSPVPEPGTVGLIGLGLAMVGMVARRRRA